MKIKPGRIFRALIILAIVGVILAWFKGGELTAAANHAINAPPADLPVATVEFRSLSGSTLRGWFLSGTQGKGAIILMHGNRSDRTSMIGRARFLWAAGYSVLLFDFQAHGESPGKHVTFGQLESLDAISAVDFIQQCAPGEKIGIIGDSLGGAAALLANPPLKVDALVLESVYPSIDEAVQNRLSMSWGLWAKNLAPLLLYQLKPRLGCFADDLRPIEHVGEMVIPKLFIAGTHDQKTTAKESMAMYLAAADPKQYWAVDGASHEDLHVFATAEYQRRVLEFFGKYLR